MKLFWCPRTRAVRALWLLEEAGLSYERVLIDVRDPASRETSGFRDASPMGKVPALEDGEVRLAESGAVALYVADRYAQGTLAPALDSPDRGHRCTLAAIPAGETIHALPEPLDVLRILAQQHRP